MPKNIRTSDIRKEAQKLIESGKMPHLDQLLGAVAVARQQYAGRIKAAQASGPEPEEGAPADFGGPVFPNPQGVKPVLDTEIKPEPMRLPTGVKANIDNAPLTNPKGDISNPATTQAIPSTNN
jgi:hypothetical protein